ncbi:MULTISPECIES: YajG family lipoprotein [unclassified Colwellia]|jgi:uncharacterized lipoprotein|uniref:YajG family lipoprotein n=1 Tax=unclassified Colwellia TaxID=196834 RepID=UPI000D3BCC10|nr:MULTISPECIES: YajG family lipoprotein [unclassified Colwellia]AWB58596.1 hypothetical protein DBO93_14225 [Colwellia sp. Arc7-D]MBA6417535.1 hypothetical protein [Colwellia sp. 6M3]|tara:strand:+ start:2875 stop:3444 length:570 start_codon:yes stop_codon:yes gene_type:complete
MKSTLFKFMLLGTTALLIACSTPIKQVIVSPELNIGSSNAYQQKQAQLGLRDLRTSPHIVQILRTGEAAILYSPQQPIIDTVEKSLSSALKANGLQIKAPAANQVEIIIDNALVSVQQSMMKYSASNQMNIRVVINNSKGTLTKTFKITGTSKGPLKADLAVLERDFNQQLAKLLTQIVQNEELQQFMQ